MLPCSRVSFLIRMVVPSDALPDLHCLLAIFEYSEKSLSQSRMSGSCLSLHVSVIQIFIKYFVNGWFTSVLENFNFFFFKVHMK